MRKQEIKCGCCCCGLLANAAIMSNSSFHINCFCAEQVEPDELYDELADDADEAWVAQHYSTSLSRCCSMLMVNSIDLKPNPKSNTRQNTHTGKEATRQGKGKGPETDAVLNCPCCFTTLCMDCQRHERYKQQFRAMFFVNCTVKTHVRVAPPDQKKGQAKLEAAEAAEEEAESEVLHPVVCATCGTEVGVQDADEVVHFFNVLAS